MCSINGFTFEDRERIQAMNRVTAHRGPDGSGYFCEDGISLGHNRLSVIDLTEAGAQPMKSADGSIVITYNGELYNFRELRSELKEYSFTSKTDTEVILAAYRQWGTEAFSRFNGMFAFALWDKRARELVLARDRSGIKPLYYAWDGKHLIFSSEIKAILEHPQIERRLDHEALSHYLRVLYTPAPFTLIKGVRKLEPGHLLVLKNGRLNVRPFSKRPDTSVEVPTDEEIQKTLERSVSRQLVSDRPLGIYLSGGLDSSIILSCAMKERDAIDTFSVNFDLGPRHPRQEVFSADANLARQTATHFGARHHEVSFSGEDAARSFEKMVWHLDEPIGNATALPMLHLGSFAKNQATVVLGGDGGDELFGGYERYRLSLLASYYQKFVPRVGRNVLNRLHPALQKLGAPAGTDRFARFMFQKDEEVSRATAAPAARDTKAFFEKNFFTPLSPDFETQFMNTDRRSWLVDECLARTDKMSMASGLEVRVPFLDEEVVALAERLPREQKVTLFETKRALRRAFRNQLPEYLFNQPKRGWFAPGGEWIKGEAFGALADEVLSESYYPESKDLFDWDEVRIMLSRHRSGEEYHMVMLWTLLILQGWMKRFSIRI